MNIVALANNTIPSANTFTFTFPVQRTTVLESNIVNPNFLRTFMLAQDAVRITQGNTQVAYRTSDLLNVAVALYPALTWPPVFTSGPNNASANITNGQSVSYSVIVSSEISVGYQWYYSIDLGVNWAALANSGIYSNVTTNHLNISNSNTLNNSFWFRCFSNSAAGNTNSRYATFTANV